VASFPLSAGEGVGFQIKRPAVGLPPSLHSEPFKSADHRIVALGRNTVDATVLPQRPLRGTQESTYIRGLRSPAPGVPHPQDGVLVRAAIPSASTDFSAGQFRAGLF
jgi:hypothetical protein